MKRGSIKAFVLFTFVLGLFSTGAEAATIKGKVSFEGTPPVLQQIKMESDPTCHATHPQGFTSEEVVVNPNGTLKNVFVYAKEGVAGKFDAPKEPVVMDQKGCHYTPHVFGIQVNQPLQIVNSDNTLHNVHALPTKSKPFNLGMPIQGMKLTKTFGSPEVMVKVKCDVHPWMGAYVGVLEHPFYGVSGEDGTFELKNLPPGQYTVEAWHEKYGSQSQAVTVGSPDETKEIGFSYKG
jgi:hypothetical protein